MAAKNKMTVVGPEGEPAPAAETIPPDENAADAGASAGPKVRGPYKKRERDRSKEKPRRREGVKADAASLTQQIVGLHVLMATMTGLPELMISEQEGRMLADASLRVADEYGVVLTGKTGAAIQLLAAAAMVYTPRLLMIRQRANAARASTPATMEGEFTPASDAPPYQ